MRLLFISYRFPPIVSSESLLIPRTLWALDQLGYDITVLTVTEESCLGAIDDNLMSLIPPSVKVIRLPGAERALSAFRGIPCKGLKMFGMTDISDPWYFSASRTGKRLLKEKSFDLLYSRASTFISNVVGLRLKRISGLPWVAHFSDPWFNNPYLFPIYNRLQRKAVGILEGPIIREADGIVFTTQQAADLVMSRYPAALFGKAHVIPHGYDPRCIPNTTTSADTCKPLRMVHAGNFFKLRNPLKLFEALRGLNNSTGLSGRLELVLIGNIEEKYRRAAEQLGLADIVKFTGQLTFSQTSQQLADSDVLLLIEAPGEVPNIFLPSKLIDYLQFLKTIFGITPSHGPSATLLQRIGCPLADPDDIQGISRAISDMLARYQNNKLLSTPQLERVSREYDIRQVTLKLHNIFSGLLKAGV